MPVGVAQKNLMAKIIEGYQGITRVRWNSV